MRPGRLGAALAAGMLLLGSAGASAERIGLGVGKRLPPFEALDLHGAPQSLERYTGQVLVLHFWASWCPYCRGEIPELTELHQAWGKQGVRVLSVSVDTDQQQLRRYLARQPLPYPVILDAALESSLADRYGISGIPVTYVIGRRAEVIARLEGSADITRAVQRALRADSRASSRRAPRQAE